MVEYFNTDICAFVTQCGFLSKLIKINRGCRQGDPISAYLFLIGAEILTRLIQINPLIEGIKIEENEFKLTHFADDTTLMLDGSQCSLQAALNTLEVYGNISGLRMNKEKTKLIWIGRKRHCKEKLNVNAHLEWGSTEFTLLGIDFSTNLEVISEINYKKVLEKIRKIVNQWKTRHLTPIGRVAVIKTYIVSQCIHILSTLPRSETFLKTLNNILYSFLWNNKPDKIRRPVTILGKKQGGLQMINIHNFEKSLKVSWIEKMFKQQSTQWFKLLTTAYKNITQIINFGDQWYIKILPKVQNLFWQNVLNDWGTFIKIRAVKNANQLVRSCIWYNSHISQNALFFPDWYNKGIYLVGDVLNNDGKFLTIQELNSKFDSNV